jgi:hypothetical protein
MSVVWTSSCQRLGHAVSVAVEGAEARWLPAVAVVEGCVAVALELLTRSRMRKPSASTERAGWRAPPPRCALSARARRRCGSRRFRRCGRAARGRCAEVVPRALVAVGGEDAIGHARRWRCRPARVTAAATLFRAGWDEAGAQRERVMAVALEWLPRARQTRLSRAAAASTRSSVHCSAPAGCCSVHESVPVGQLLGVRPELLDELRARGVPTRVSVPYGAACFRGIGAGSWPVPKARR